MSLATYQKVIEGWRPANGIWQLMKGMGIINTFRVAQSDPKHIPKGQRSAISDGIVKSTKVILNQDQALTWKSTEL